MDHPQLYDGRLHAPYFIFIRVENTLSDTDLLNHFGLSNCRSIDNPLLTKSDPDKLEDGSKSIYQKLKRVAAFDRYVVIGNVGQWMMLADNWYYSLWYAKETRPAIEKLALRYDVFSYSVGECDLSFEFCLYQKGQIVRKLVVSSPNYTDQKIVETIGNPIPDEKSIWSENHDDLIRLQLLANSLGINPIFEMNELRVYYRKHT